MNILYILLRASRTVFAVAVLIGMVSGAASVGLIALIHRALRQSGGSAGLIVLFVGLCLVVLISRVLSQVLLTRLSQQSLSRLTMHLCRLILDSPLAQIERLGSSKLMASLTGDVAVVANAVNGFPAIVANLIMLAGGVLYLGWMSPTAVLLGLAFMVLGMLSHRATARHARRHLRESREHADVLMHHFRNMTDGIKELKLHRERCEDFYGNHLEETDAQARESQIRGLTIQAFAATWGRILFLLAIALVLFLWPQLEAIDQATLSAYVLTILFLMAPLERITAWLPLFARARVALRKIRELNLALEQTEPAAATGASFSEWRRIELCDLQYRYQEDGSRTFDLGPIDLSLEPGEIVFIAGGNGSGKTTLLKLLVGLYDPLGGDIRAGGETITPQNREAYRQLFAAVFAEATLFDNLLGIGGERVDEDARRLLADLQLDHEVRVEEGRFSTLKLSKGQRKRLALMTAYLEDRPIYVFDEWAADQDPHFKRVFYRRLLPELKARGKLVVAVTHDDNYYHAADRLIVLRDGRIVEEAEQRPDATALSDEQVDDVSVGLEFSQRE